MRLARVVAPTEDIVSLPDVKAQARVDHGDEDALLTSCRDAAVAWMDGRSGVLGRALAPQTWELTLSGFPAPAIDLPLGPFLDMVSIVYVDVAGGSVTLAPAAYRAEVAGDSATVVPVVAWPPTAARTDAVRIRWRCGSPASGVPEPIRRAVLALASYWYDNRGEGDVPESVWTMIQPYRRMGL